MAAFDEETAKEIIEKFNLDLKTIKVWRTRGKIPDRYFDPEYDHSEGLKDHDTEYQKFIEILGYKEIASTKFRCLKQKGADVQRKKDRMTKNERIGFKTEVTELRNKLRAFIDAPSERTIKPLLTDGRLHPTLLFSNAVQSQVLKGHQLLTDKQKLELKVLAMSLYNRLKV